MKSSLDFWSNNFLTTLLQFPVYECMSSVQCKKCHLPSLFATLQYWFNALASISSAWCSKGLFSGMVILSKGCCSAGCREKLNCFSYLDSRLSTTLSTETFTHATQIRWIITLTFLNKAIFSFFRIDWIISLLSNIEGSNVLQDLINSVYKLATNIR